MNNQINENTAAKQVTKQGESMTIEIPKDKWTEFLNDFSKRRFGWGTKVEVLDKSVGDQMLSEGLVLNGVTFEDKSGNFNIEISLGEDVEKHQTHTVLNPVKMAYLSENDSHVGVLEIEEENGTKTLISLIKPMPVYFGYASYEVRTAV
jgi:Family of unknown function (DUF5335)